MRKLAAAVDTRKPSFSATTMGVWVVREERCDEVGAKFAFNKAVSHCYRRPVYSDWPYNVYTTVHARSVDECESIINDLAIDTGVEQKQALFPTREYRKARVQFFSREAEEWEDTHAASREAAAS